MIGRRRLGLIALLAITLSAPVALAAGAPPAEYKAPEPPRRKAPVAGEGLRGAAPPAGIRATQAPTAPTAPVTPPPRVAPGRPRDLGLMSPNLSQPPVPRVRGWDGPSSVGGAQCRTGCSRDQYVCLAGDGGDCNSAWSRCVAACPEGSAGAL